MSNCNIFQLGDSNLLIESHISISNDLSDIERLKKIVIYLFEKSQAQSKKIYELEYIINECIPEANNYMDDLDF